MPPPTEPAAPPPIEMVWHVQATYAPDAAETRAPFRAEHIARMQALKASGVLTEVGAFLDVSATVAIVRAASEAEAIELFRQDVYMRNGVWVEIRARPFGRVRDPGSPRRDPSQAHRPTAPGHPSPWS